MTGEVCGARGLGQPETEPELEFASRGSTQHPEFTMPQPLRRDMKLLIKGGMSEIARSVIGGIPVSLFKRPAPSPMRRRPFALSRSPPLRESSHQTRPATPPPAVLAHLPASGAAGNRQITLEASQRALQGPSAERSSFRHAERCRPEERSGGGLPQWRMAGGSPGR